MRAETCLVTCAMNHNIVWRRFGPLHYHSSRMVNPNPKHKERDHCEQAIYSGMNKIFKASCLFSPVSLSLVREVRERILCSPKIHPERLSLHAVMINKH